MNKFRLNITYYLFDKKRLYSKLYNPITINQKEYNNALYNKKISLIVCTGPAGTGKTLMACQYAIENLFKNDINKIIITRPSISIDENLGFLPGNINNKMLPWTIPIFDIFKELYDNKQITEFIKDNIIEIAPLGFIQGRTFKNSIVIADEMQNSTPQQMFMLLTRIGINSKIVITGDLMQTKNKENGLNNFIEEYKKKYENIRNINNEIKFINLEKDDIQRSKIVKIINEIYNK